MKTKCDMCGKELIAVWPDQSRRHDDDQFESVLHIYLVGGYGEYIDTDHIFGEYHRRLCETCADEFMASPAMEKLYGGDNEE